MSLNVGMRYSLPVMFHVFPVVRGEKTQQSRITDMAHIIRHVEKSGTHHLRSEEGENNNIYQPQSRVVRGSGDALLTGCYVPCVPSSEEERKHSSEGSLIWHTSLGLVEKSGTHPLRWKEGENNNI